MRHSIRMIFLVLITVECQYVVMLCTYCGSKTRVSNSRLQKRTNSIWRRRLCLRCNRIFTTNEQVDFEKSWVVQYTSSEAQKKGRPAKSQPFLRDKLLISIHNSLGHRGLAALPDSLAITQTVTGRLGKMISPEGCLPASAIVKTTYSVLRNFDKVGATVYRAYHNSLT
jgi:transcriptional regulator NrdR family protein